ncbi:NADH-quinone oxidoreductase subunit J [uncultured Bacteroides sp.]|uniref:NADH-quinone oxidoreductase subunit J family protein n=1 Tax=uncultured Bacteroides sp. TaxID=162156 RepID=UPI00261BADEE|nr:NADH-quinone oxidoreductase subunit J [uncultured Bacteroides sp.]
MFSLFEIAFYVVALCIIVFSVLAVTTNSILRSATYLLFVLLATGGIYAILGYTFLSAVQLMVYAGGIIVLYVFSILLTRSSGTMKYKIGRGKMISVLLTTLVGMALVMFLIATNGFALNIIPQGVELPVEKIGEALIGTEKYQFVLPFEVMSVLLLACMIGAIMIARKRN